jgi:hypothetical protein
MKTLIFISALIWAVSLTLFLAEWIDHAPLTIYELETMAEKE